MEWFGGPVSAAIQQAKSSKCLFVVYIFGQDDLSKQMETTWSDTAVSSLCHQCHLVAIRLDAKSTECSQFSAIYPVVIVPSTYFIGENGVPLEVAGGSFQPQEFIEKIKKVRQLHADQLNAVSASQNTPSLLGEAQAQPTSTATTPSGNSTDGGATTTPQTAGDSSAPSPPEQSQSDPIVVRATSLEDKVDRAKQLIEQKRQEKEAAEKEKERQKEIERRGLGKDMLKAKQWREEYQQRELKEERRKEKEMERLAREKVKAQIAKDKEERAARFHKEKEAREMAASQARLAREEKKAEEEAQNAATRSLTARLQFRLPDGSSVTQQFPSSDPLKSARNFIGQHVSGTLGNSFVLKTTFPNRTFTDTDMELSLLDLRLSPTAVLLVLPGTQGGSNMSSPSGASGFIQTLLAPLLMLWNFLCTFLFGTPSQSTIQHGVPQDSGDSVQYASNSSTRKRPVSNTENKKDGKVHRLFSGRDSDDDDENATWNGNSTQQM